MTLNRRAFSTLVAGAGLAAATTTAFAQGAAVDVAISRTSKFDPDAVNIKVGDTITWTNGGFVIHTVTFDPGLSKNVVLPAGVAPFGSADLEEDATFAHQFTVKGTYKYVCKYHEEMGMIGTVVVS